MRILILIPAQDRATGNRVTAERFRAGLQTRGQTVELLETGLEPSPGLREQVDAFQPEVVLLLHAYRSGRPWLALGRAETPAVCLMTGTDVNLGLDDPVQQPVITAVLERSAVILLQNRRLTAALTERLPRQAGKIHYLPPGIVLGRAPFDVRRQLGLAAKTALFFCPAGVRPIKDQTGLLELFDPLAAQGPTFHLAFCGPVLDRDYAETFRGMVAARPWASDLGVIPPEAMAAATASTDVVINNSRAEGLPNALLEATALGIPILARDIPGNADVVEDGHNGLLYRNPQEFADCVRRLLGDPGLRTALRNPEPGRYRPEQESAALERFLVTALADDTG